MKVAEAHKSNAARNHIQAKQQPFFKKEGENGFFSKSNETATPFFEHATIQPKLTIGEPNDKYEIEADAMADQVVQKLEEPSIEANALENKKEDAVQTKPIDTIAIQAKCNECDDEEKLQKKEEDEITETDVEVQEKAIFESNTEQIEAEVQTKQESSDNLSWDNISAVGGIGTSTLQPEIQAKCNACEEEEQVQKKEEDEIAETDVEVQEKPIFESNTEQPEVEVQAKPLEIITSSPDIVSSNVETGPQLLETVQPKSQIQQSTPVNISKVIEPEDQQESEEELSETGEEIHRKIEAGDTPELPEDDESTIQAKSDNSLVNSGNSLQNRLNSSKGTGSPLSSNVRDGMGNAFGADFNNVRVHTGSEAVQMSKDLGAQAFTHGSDIYFNESKFDTNSNSGKHLLAHELTHTIQQGSSKPSIQKNNEPSPIIRSIARVLNWIPGVDTNVEEVIERGSAIYVHQLSDEQIRSATKDQRINLIVILNKQNWVGPLDESLIEFIWSTFSGEGRLLDVVTEHIEVWKESSEKGATLDEFPEITILKAKFEEDVKHRANQYLEQNREHINSELRRLGLAQIDDDRSEHLPPTMNVRFRRRRSLSEQQTTYLQEIQRASLHVTRAQQGIADLVNIPVGYNREGHSTGGSSVGYDNVQANFNPNRPPESAPNGDESPPFASWSETKRQYDRLTAVISNFSNQYPSVFSLVEQERIDDLVGASNNEDAVQAIDRSLRFTYGKINESDSKIETDDLHWEDLIPIHQQVYDNGVSEYTSVYWGDENGIERWAAEKSIEDHEDQEFWIQIGLTTLAAAAFVIAELATFGTATFFIAAGVGLGATFAQAAIGWEEYFDMADAAQTSVNNELSLISEETVDGQLTTAVIDTVFAFIDIYGVTRGARAATTVGREALEQSERRLAEELAQSVTEQAGRREATEQTGRELLEEAGEETIEQGSRSFISILAQRLRSFGESLRDWGRRVFDRYRFRSYEVTIEGNYLILYGIRSRIRLARIRKGSVERWFIENDDVLRGLRHSRSSQLGRATSAAAQGDEALRNLLRGNAIRLSEEIGEEAIEAIIETAYPNAVRLFRGSGSGVLDLVYRLPGGRILIVEAKGGTGRLGSRLLEEGVRAQQGTASYLRDILRSMIRRGGTHETAAREILEAWRNGRLTYQLGKVSIPRGTGPLRGSIRDFVLGALDLSDEALGL